MSPGCCWESIEVLDCLFLCLLCLWIDLLGDGDIRELKTSPLPSALPWDRRNGVSDLENIDCQLSLTTQYHLTPLKHETRQLVRAYISYQHQPSWNVLYGALSRPRKLILSRLKFDCRIDTSNAHLSLCCVVSVLSAMSASQHWVVSGVAGVCSPGVGGR